MKLFQKNFIYKINYSPGYYPRKFPGEFTKLSAIILFLAISCGTPQNEETEILSSRTKTQPSQICEVFFPKNVNDSEDVAITRMIEYGTGKVWNNPVFFCGVYWRVRKQNDSFYVETNNGWNFKILEYYPETPCKSALKSFQLIGTGCALRYAPKKTFIYVR